MDRQDQRAIVGDHQHVGVTSMPCAASFSTSAFKRPRVEHDAVADHRRRAAHDPAGQQRQLVHLVADDQRMPGVMAALEAHHHVGAARQPVDDLALAFVAPLGADDGDVSHVCSLSRAARVALGGERQRVQFESPQETCSITEQKRVLVLFLIGYSRAVIGSRRQCQRLLDDYRLLLHIGTYWF